jgi:hypothetical protein
MLEDIFSNSGCVACIVIIVVLALNVAIFTQRVSTPPGGVEDSWKPFAAQSGLLLKREHGSIIMQGRYQGREVVIRAYHDIWGKLAQRLMEIDMVVKNPSDVLVNDSALRTNLRRLNVQHRLEFADNNLHFEMTGVIWEPSALHNVLDLLSQFADSIEQ